MVNSTLCYLERGDAYLMLHRVKKKDDLNRDKWIGVGGKFEEGESPEDCILRETEEETGLTLTDYRYRGLVTFVSDEAPTDICTSSPPPAGQARPTPATRGSWPGSKRRSCGACPCGRGTGSFWICWSGTSPSSP